MEHGTRDDTAGQVEGRQPALLDAKEVARLLSCSQRSVRRLADSGRIPAPIRLGRLVRWSRQTLQNWIAEGCPSRKTRR